jgi:hypothetical protein
LHIHSQFILLASSSLLTKPYHSDFRFMSWFIHCPCVIEACIAIIASDSHFTLNFCLHCPHVMEAFNNHFHLH